VKNAPVAFLAMAAVLSLWSTAHVSAAGSCGNFKLSRTTQLGMAQQCQSFDHLTIEWSTNLNTLSLPMTSCAQLSITLNGARISSLVFPGLRTIAGSLQLTLHNGASVSLVKFIALATVDAGISVRVDSSNARIGNILLPALTRVAGDVLLGADAGNHVVRASKIARPPAASYHNSLTILPSHVALSNCRLRPSLFL